jgi:hypothetical protein
MRLFVPGLFVVFFVAIGASCSRDESTKSTSPESGACRITTDCEAPLVCVNRSCALPAVVDPKAAIVEKAASIPLPKSVNRPVLVGGCLGQCDRPKDSVHHFLEAVLSKERDLSLIRSFVESSILQHNRERLGETWADMYRAGDLTKRAESIDRWLRQWLEWADRIADPMDRSVKRASVRVVFQDQSRYVIEYQRPDLKEEMMQRSLGLIWRMEWRRRGLEWLIARIDDQAPPVRSTP